MDIFRERVEDILSVIGPDKLTYEASEVWMYQKTYDYVEKYAYRKELLNTALALPVTRSLYDGNYRGSIRDEGGETWRKPYFYHALAVAAMLIHLHLPLSAEEEDIVLASALCHDLKLFVHFPDDGWEMESIYHLDPRIVSIMLLIYEGDCETEADYQKVFRAVSQNKLALLVRLADRGNVAESLHSVSVWKAHELIYETRTFYMPMCIYARENYPELDATIGILHEKLRDLIQATDIFVSRYESREKELAERILQMQEENSRMRILIRKKKEALEQKEELKLTR